MNRYDKEIRVSHLQPDDLVVLINQCLDRKLGSQEQGARLQVAAKLGCVDRRMLATLYDVSERTIKDWAEDLGFEEVDGPNGRRVYYDLDDVEEKLKARG